MGCCYSRKNKRKKQIAQITTDKETHKPDHKAQDTTEIILKDASHLTIKLTINPDDSTTYTISRPRSTQKSCIEIVNGENEISITNTPIQTCTSEPPIRTIEPDTPIDSQQSPAPSTTALLPPNPQTDPVTSDKEPPKQTDPPTSSQLLPHPPLRVPSALRRQRLRFPTHAVSSLSSTDPSSSALSSEPSSLLNAVSSAPLLTPSTSEYDTESPIGSLSPELTTDKNSSHSLPSAFQSKQVDTQFSSLPTVDSIGHFSKRLLVTSTPPLPPMCHRTPITPIQTEGTPLRIPIYDNGNKQSFASFPKRVKIPRRFQGHFRCNECLCDWASNYTWEGWGQKCRRCKTNVCPCYPYRLDTLESVTKVSAEPHSVAAEPHSVAHCLRCQHLKRTIDTKITCISYSKLSE